MSLAKVWCILKRLRPAVPPTASPNSDPQSYLDCLSPPAAYPRPRWFCMPAHSSRRSNASTPYAKLARSFGFVVMSTTHCLPIVARRTRGRHRVPLTQNPWRIRSVSCVCGMRYCTRKPSARRSHSVPPIMHTPTHSTYPPLSACLEPTNAGAFATCRVCGWRRKHVPARGYFAASMRA
ncbi:hypothetical protein C8R43DRAFT_1135544 [Mycena crocata]|nr:hypothetical protein C8R43DRAFT_1135544 [Mycena crocata]